MCVRPQKKKFVCRFPTNPKYLKRVDFFFLILNFVFLNINVKMKCQSIYIVTVPKRHKLIIMEYNPLPRMKQILGLFMPPELIFAVILVSSRYENQFLSLSYAVNVAVSVQTLAN